MIIADKISIDDHHGEVATSSVNLIGRPQRLHLRVRHR